ncbi:MAG: SEL1-like repeat protein [Myxococcales bacterium]|nr:SEL1-like repeat protein [Myxococcales bacterium]
MRHDRDAGFVCPFCDAALAPATVDAGACSSCHRALEVCERYRLREVLGRGGMARVYLGEDRDGRRVAVKVLGLRRESAADDGDDDGWATWEMFERSSRVLSGLQHPNLPRVFAFAREADRLVLVRELFDGGTLAERIAAGRRLEAAAMHRLADTMLQLLAYLHGLVPPVIHRDIKPANIMFRTMADWDPVLVDFDTVAAPEGLRSGLTIVASLGYSAPEQLAGEASPASDLYELGATLLHLATGTPPEKLPRRHGRFELDGALDELDPALRQVLTRLVEPDPDERYGHADGALADLRHEPAVREAPASPPSLSKSAESRRPSLRTVLTIAAVLVFFGLIIFLFARGESSHIKSERRDCDSRVARACWRLGTHYENGKGVTRDLPRSVRLYRKACELGYGLGCAFLADMLSWGKGTLVDAQGSTAAYLKACKIGHLRSCAAACWRVKEGTGTSADPLRARTLCERGCNGGDSYSCNNLALFYKHGVTVARDLSRAERLFDLACRKKDGAACHNLAEMVRQRNPSRARALDRQGCKLKNAAACTAVKNGR